MQTCCDDQDREGLCFELETAESQQGEHEEMSSGENSQEMAMRKKCAVYEDSSQARDRVPALIALTCVMCYN